MFFFPLLASPPPFETNFFLLNKKAKKIKE